MSDIDFRHRIGSLFATPVARVLSHTPLTPNTVSWLGFLLTCGAGFLVARHYFLWGGIVVLIAGLMDSFDGALARLTARVSRFGAILDSTLDRWSEGIVLIAVIYALAVDGSAWGAALGGVTMLMSFSVSYIRSRAEGMGVTCSEGWFTRVERVVVISLGLIISQVIIALAVVAALSLLTSMQRLFVVRRKLRQEG
ncbi:MAG: CDP-alcohol phosphatidyltransferase family protein [Dehalococcoidia bacterium]|nr:CDP-alcohol phosphatidyltransferase family protein [Dehalococcoidia bacterium]